MNVNSLGRIGGEGSVGLIKVMPKKERISDSTARG